MFKSLWETTEIPLGDQKLLTVSFTKCEDSIIQIHISKCFDKLVMNDIAIEIVNRFKSRTEYDECGTGINILCKGDLPISPKEPYVFPVGLSVFRNEEFIVYQDIKPCQNSIDWLFDEYLSFLLTSEEPPEEFDQYWKLMYYNVTLEGTKLILKPLSIPTGKRHKELISFGKRLVDHGIPGESIPRRMYDLNLLYCVPPLPVTEMQGIIQSVVNMHNREVL